MRVANQMASTTEDCWNVAFFRFSSRIAGAHPKDIRCRFSNGFLVSDPQRNWALTNYGGTVYSNINKSTFKTEAVLEYPDDRSSFPIPSRRTQHKTWPDDKGTVLEKELTSKNVTNKVSKEEFYLRYYGLPEPKFGRRWYGNWVWILLLMIGAIGLGVFLRKRCLRML